VRILKELTLRIIVTVISVEILVTSTPTTYRNRRPNFQKKYRARIIVIVVRGAILVTSAPTTYRNRRPISDYIMNTRRLLRNHHDQDTAYSGLSVDESDYDPHWKDRLLPGNQEIYGRASEQARLLHEQYIEISPGILRHVVRHGGHPVHGYDVRQGGPRYLALDRGTQGPQAGHGTSRRRDSTCSSNEHECRGSRRGRESRLRRVGYRTLNEQCHPPGTAAHPCTPTGLGYKDDDAHRYWPLRRMSTRTQVLRQCHTARQQPSSNRTSSG